MTHRNQKTQGELDPDLGLEGNVPVQADASDRSYIPSGDSRAQGK
jgi:hypothetical protein